MTRPQNSVMYEAAFNLLGVKPRPTKEIAKILHVPWETAWRYMQKLCLEGRAERIFIADIECFCKKQKESAIHENIQVISVE